MWKLAIRRSWPCWLLLASILGGAAASGEAAEDPKLVVVLAFDQLRADYLTRWAHLFEEGGFRRLCEDGAWFQNCHYPYAMTVTAAGHASLSTGAFPRTHGILGNDWFEPAAGRTVSCVDGGRWKLRVWTDDAKAASTERTGGSPEKLLVPAVGDLVKEKYGEKSRVVALSVKDRSAILLGGHKADAVYWADPKTGLMATSSYYGDHIHEWVRKFNNEKPADRWLGAKWEKLRTDVDYEKEAGPDDAKGEGAGLMQGRVFPHPFARQPGPVYYESVAVSPFASDLLVDLAIRAIREEKLGQRDSPDVLCISFSSNDLVGHVWGPDSQEVLDTTLRSDRNVHQLLDELDKSVGKDKYLVTVSADHGVCPLPDALRAKGIDAGVLFVSELINGANKFLNDRYKAKDGTNWIAGTATSWLAVDRNAVNEHRLDSKDVVEALAEWMSKQRGIAMAVTRETLDHAKPNEDPIIEMVRKSYRPDRTGDIAIVPKPHYFFAPMLTGTSHGTPHEYDTHVPLVFFGSRVRSGIRKEAVVPEAMAAVLLKALGIEPPKTVEVVVPAGTID